MRLHFLIFPSLVIPGIASPDYCYLVRYFLHEKAVIQIARLQPDPDLNAMLKRELQLADYEEALHTHADEDIEKRFDPGGYKHSKCTMRRWK